MTGGLLEQRCWNHETREAVCRCPECARSYCRECVIEHQGRLLCAACVGRVARQAAPRAGGSGLQAAAMLAGGLLLAWLLFWGAGEGILALTGRG